MIGILFFALAICLFIQMTIWTLDSFRWGITAISFSTSFPSNVPENIINQELKYKSITFKFITQNIGLFKPKLKMRGRIGFPLLGEMRFTKKGAIQIKIRIPLSFVLLAIVSFIGLVSFFMQGVYTLDAIVQGLVEASAMIAFIGIFFLIGFFVEKDRIEYSIE